MTVKQPHLIRSGSFDVRCQLMPARQTVTSEMTLENRMVVDITSASRL